MAKARSPQYPSIGLREAVEKVHSIYENDYQNPITRVVAAQRMGYNTLNGKSLGVLSALGKYGLLEGRGDNTRVSDLAVRIIAHGPGEPERAEAIDEAARMPGLFQELESRYPGGKASENAIRSYLLTQKFIPSAADAVIRSYRETRQLVDEEGPGYNESGLSGGESPMQSAASVPVSVFPGHSGAVADLRQVKSSALNEIANIRVSKDCAIRLVADGPYDKRSIEALVKNLQLQLELGTYDDATEIDQLS